MATEAINTSSSYRADCILHELEQGKPARTTIYPVVPK